MPINIGRSLISAGVGVVDEVATYWDEQEGRTESFKNAVDISRLLIAGAGYAMQVFMPRMAVMGETLALSATPLLVKSISKPVRSAIGGGTTAAAFPRARARAIAAPMAPRLPAGSPVRAQLPEFETVRLT